MRQNESSNDTLLPPHPFIRKIGELLVPSRLIIDLGSGLGRNAFYLSDLGHKVMAMDLIEGNIDFTQIIKQNRSGPQPSFLRGDLRQLPFKQHSADVVLVNEVLHLMSKTASRQALSAARDITRPEGLNVVTGYAADDSVMNKKNRAQAFSPGELAVTYTAEGWKILQYEEIQLQARVIQGKEHMGSLAAIIAQAPLE